MVAIFNKTKDLISQLQSEEDLVDCLEKFEVIIETEENIKYIEDYLKYYNTFYDLFDYDLVLCKYIVRNSFNQFYDLAVDKEQRLYNIEEKFISLDNIHRGRMKKSNLLNGIINSDKYSKYRQFFKEILEKSDEDKKLIMEMRQFGVDAWYDLYQKHVTKLQFLYDGNKISYMELKEQLAKENNIEKKCIEYNRFCEKLRSEEWLFDYYLTQIKKYQVFLAKYHGEENPLHKIINEHRMDIATINMLDKYILESKKFALLRSQGTPVVS